MIGWVTKMRKSGLIPAKTKRSSLIWLYLFIYAPTSLLFRNPVDHIGMGSLMDGQGTNFFIKKIEIEIPVTGRGKEGKISFKMWSGKKKVWLFLPSDSDSGN